MLHGKSGIEMLEKPPVSEQIEGNGIGSIFRQASA
jgi:hypothetical protein